MESDAGIPAEDLQGNVTVSASCPGTLLHLLTSRHGSGNGQAVGQMTQSDCPNDNPAATSPELLSARIPRAHPLLTHPKRWLLVRYPNTHPGYPDPIEPHP